ncbi:MAG: hypothetical protein ACO1OB_30845 [Archangium sp.]
MSQPEQETEEQRLERAFDFVELQMLKRRKAGLPMVDPQSLHSVDFQLLTLTRRIDRDRTEVERVTNALKNGGLRAQD